MPSDVVFRKGLAALHVTFPNREPSRALADTYRAALADLTDTEFETGVTRCVRECTFFPAPAEIRDRVAVERSVILDPVDLLRRIEFCGHYNPNVGHIPPSVHRVREVFGDDVAAAYAGAGAGECFSEEDTTRSIARRDFNVRLEKAPAIARARIAAGMAQPLALPAQQTKEPEAIAPHVRGLIANVGQSMRAERRGSSEVAG